MQRIRINENVTVGGQPSLDEVNELADEGFQSVVNLRESHEDGDKYSSRDEGVTARERGITYLNYPVPKEQIEEALVDGFRSSMSLLPKPAYVHCGSGQRAGALVLMNEALDQGWSGEETLDRAEQLGVDCRSSQLREFVRDYVDRHSD